MLARDEAAPARAERHFFAALASAGLSISDEPSSSARAAAALDDSAGGSGDGEGDANLAALRAAPWAVDALKNARWAAQARNAAELAEALKVLIPVFRPFAADSTLRLATPLSALIRTKTSRGFRTVCRGHSGVRLSVIGEAVAR